MSALLRITRPLRSPTLAQPCPSPLSSKFFSAHLRFPPRSRALQTRINPYARENANNKVLYTFMGANISIFAYSIYLREAARQGDVEPFSRFVQNMTMNLEDCRAGRWWTILTSQFTHLSINHIFCNMFSAYFLGSFLASAPMITPTRYIMIAIGSGISGSVGYLYHRYVQMQQNGQVDTARGLGFSGALMGISTVAACIAPKAKFSLYGIIPVPLWGLVAGYALYDGFFLNDAHSSTAHAGHLGGTAFGLAYYFLRLRGLRF